MIRRKSEAGLIDLALSGLRFEEIDQLTAYQDVPAADPDAVLTIPEHSIVKMGDIYLLGDHRLACGDSTDPATVAALLGADRPHLMVTDPPYGVDYDPNWRNKAFRTNGTPSDGRAVGIVANDTRVDWSTAWQLFPGDVAYVWLASTAIGTVQASLEASGFVTRYLIIWNKSRFVIGRGDYHWKHEPCWYAVRKGSKGHWNGARDQTTVWDIAHTVSTSGHGTQKPVECMRRPIINNSIEGDAVYEPFSGSGTTIIAAEMEHRRCLAIELNPLYVYVALTRWQKFTGRNAVLAATGESFPELLRRRMNEPNSVPTPIITRPSQSPPTQPSPASTALPVTITPRAIQAMPVQVAARVLETAWTIPTELPQLQNRGAKLIGFDTETYDPDLRTLGPSVRRGGYMVGFSIAVDDDGPRLYIPFRHEGGDNLDEDKVRAWAKSELATFDGALCGANLIYDLDFAAQWGLEFQASAYHDVQLVEALLDEWSDDYRLDTLALRYLGRAKDEKLLRQASRLRGWTSDNDVKENLWRLPARYVGPYAETDADLPLKIWAIQQPKLEAEGLGPIYEVERKLIPILLAMKRRGVRVNLRRAEEVKATLVAQRDQHLSEARRIAGHDLELMAPESFAQTLAERGLKFPLTAKTHKPSITKPWLAANESDALVAQIQAGRRLEPIINTFLSGHIGKYSIPEGDGYGRVHGQFNQMKGQDEDGNRRGAVARFSSSHPNLQNLPKRDEELGPLIRSIFEPEPDEYWESQDLSQIEFRYLTHFAIGPGADEARQHYNEDRSTDYYRMAMEFAGADPTNRRLRDAYKALILAKGYGAGRDKLQRMLMALGLSLLDANSVIDSIEHRMPFASATYKAAANWAERYGTVTTILGRLQRFPFWAPLHRNDDFTFCRDREEAVQRWGNNIGRAWSWKALNRKLQGSAADHIKKAMVDAHEAGVTRALGPILVTVHDENGWSVPRTKEGTDAAAEARRIMEECVPLKIPVMCKVERGPNWGEAK